MNGGAGMRGKRLLLFFMTIVCSFCVAGAVFAVDGTDVVAEAKPHNGIDRGDGVVMTARQDARQDDAGTGSTASVFSGTHVVSGSRYSLIDRTSEMFKVLSVVERRVGDEKLLKKIRDKLPALSDDRLQMIASLSEKIVADDHSARTDIAFLILTTLIILS
jgi:hypothetical protein